MCIYAYKFIYVYTHINVHSVQKDYSTEYICMFILYVCICIIWYYPQIQVYWGRGLISK